MALLKKLNTRASLNDQTGFGTNSANSGGRFYTKNGMPNRTIKGISWLERFSIYHSLLALPGWKFLSIIFSFYISVNLVFGFIYFFIGTHHLAGVIGGDSFQNFTEAFFFSAQTFTTVGYGRISPVGFMASTIAAFEAMIGLLSFAIVTGLFYGRFSKPEAFLKYSKNALMSPYKNGVAVMLRMVTYKNNVLTDVEVKATLAMKVQEDGSVNNKFFNMQLEISKLNTLTYSWTLVHPVNEQSPFYNLSKEDLLNANAEILVFVKAFDESFSNAVISRTSYHASEFVYGAKFKVMYNPSPDNNSTILNIDKIDDYDPAELPHDV
jgi:inward rectifier potassium channel